MYIKVLLFATEKGWLWLVSGWSNLRNLQLYILLVRQVYVKDKVEFIVFPFVHFFCVFLKLFVGTQMCSHMKVFSIVWPVSFIFICTIILTMYISSIWRSLERLMISQVHAFILVNPQVWATFIKCVRFSEKLVFLTPWLAHACVHARGYEMLVLLENLWAY